MPATKCSAADDDTGGGGGSSGGGGGSSSGGSTTSTSLNGGEIFGIVLAVLVLVGIVAFFVVMKLKDNSATDNTTYQPMADNEMVSQRPGF